MWVQLRHLPNTTTDRQQRRLMDYERALQQASLPRSSSIASFFDYLGIPGPDSPDLAALVSTAPS